MKEGFANLQNSNRHVVGAQSWLLLLQLNSGEEQMKKNKQTNRDTILKFKDKETHSFKTGSEMFIVKSQSC